MIDRYYQNRSLLHTQESKEKIKENTIIELEKGSGKVVNAWGADLFIMPHGLEIDNDDNIWITDVGLHQVIKFSSSGEELMVLGKKNKLDPKTLALKLKDIFLLIWLNQLCGYSSLLRGCKNNNLFYKSEFFTINFFLLFSKSINKRI